MRHIGIDLGTTNTVAAINAEVFNADQHNVPLLPSVVAFPPNGARLVGTEARRRRPIDPKNTIISAKRLIGRKWYSADTKEFQRRYDFDLVENEDGEPNFKTRSGLFNPTDIATMVVERVSNYSSYGFGELIGIITVPSMFRDAEREATLEAGRQAGLADVKIVDEPMAVAMAYLSKRREEIRYAAVYDFGGGTFDLAILDCSKEEIEVLGYGGDLYLGGDDIDQGLASWAADEVLRRHRWDLRSDPAVFSRLVTECEQAKIRLSRESRTRMDLTRVDPASPISVDLFVDQKLLVLLANKIVRRTFVLCDEVLGKLGLKAQEMDAVFLAGGPTQLPIIKEEVEKYFGKTINYAFNPMQIVAIGASIVFLSGRVAAG